MIHKIRDKGFNIIMDINSGAVHVVDDLVFEIVSLMERDSEISDESVCRSLSPEYSENEIIEALEEVRTLIKQKYLFSPDIYKDYAKEFIERQAEEGIIKAMCLHVAHDCNLKCAYCFAGEGEYHGDRGLMDFETGKAALDFLMDRSGSRVNLEVDFFGGEPTMNFDVVKRLVSYGREQEKIRNKKFRFTLTTNGILLNDEILDFVNAQMGNLVLSIDGRKEVNDRMRPTANGLGSSYDIIVPKFLKAAKSRNQTNYYVRGTYTHYNTDFAKDVLHLHDLGFEQISVEPVVCDPSEPYAIQESDIDVLCEQYDILVDEIIKIRKSGGFINFFHFMLDLSGGPCLAKRVKGCGSGTEYVAVTPNGDIYPCHQFAGEKEFLMGNVKTGMDRPDIAKNFSRCNVYSKADCKDCFAKFYCSGGCAANAYHSTGDINSTYKIGCALQRKRLECAVILKAALGDS
ncbi:MAG: thioether cross-link-forming SCIFF peptide maturase [Lachnospiraceae bacterium]|nr:thioether cross-link-forming SCIFF peptide maturase [Lachnospiraceae bacterium]